MEKLNVALVGLNFGQKFILDENYKEGTVFHNFYHITAVCDKDKTRLAAVSQSYGITPYLNLDDMLQNENIQAVILMTGPVGRSKIIRKIIESGKDVLTTKPFDLSSKEAESVLCEARKRDAIVYMNSPSPTHTKDMATIKKWQTDYDLGRLVMGHHECWYKSVEDPDGSWYDDPLLCPVAPIFRLGIYGLNDMIPLFGEPKEVQVMETRLFTHRPTPDLARLSIKFKNGAMADLVDGWVPQPGRGAESMDLYFENGTIHRNPILTGQDPAKETTQLVLTTKDSINGASIKEITLSKNDLSHRYPWEIFYHTVKTRKRPLDELEDRDIVNVIRVIEAMQRASVSGRTEPVLS